MRNAIIVGGAGFVGSHLADLCLANDCHVLVYDNFSTGRREFLPSDSRLSIVEGNILDTQHLKDAVYEFSPDVVYHLAAIHHIPTCEKAPEQALRINVEGTQSVLTACAENKAPRVVFASTGALYDPKQQDALDEQSPLDVQNIYGISKLAGEQLVKYYTAKTETQAVVARLFNVVGRRETNSHVVPAIMAQLYGGNRQITLGNLHPRRDYIHVEDVTEALFALGNVSVKQQFDVFNVGSGQEHSVGQLVELCSDVIEEPIEIISDPQRRRKVDRPNQLADIGKIQRATQWKPTRTLQQALEEIWEETLSGYMVIQA